MLTKLKTLAKTKQHLVFDFDLTIAKMDIDWKNWHPGVAEIFKKYDPKNLYRNGMNPHGFYNTMAQKHEGNLVQEIKDFNANYEEKNLKQFIPYTELVNLIKSLTNNSLYIYSSNSKATVEKGLVELKLSKHFKQLITRDDVTLLKPIPEGFNLITDFEKNKNNFLMIGDSSSDENAAKTAGIEFLKCEYFGTYVFEED